jgi:hypothetical protein
MRRTVILGWMWLLSFVIALGLLHAVGFAAGVKLIPLSTDAAVCQVKEPGGAGSGVLIGWTKDKKLALVISCHHLCGDPGSLVDCYFRNVPAMANVAHPGRVVLADATLDLAAVLIYNPGVPPVAIGDFQKHEGVYSACGYGDGKYHCTNAPLYRFPPGVKLTDGGLLLTSCAIIPGDSGGCLFDPLGGFCGVTNGRGEREDFGSPNGVTLSRSGDGLKSFILVATKKCSIFTRWRERRSGGGGGGGDASCPTCGPGGCPDVAGGPSGAIPGYTNLTPVQAPAAAQIVSPAPVAATTVVQVQPARPVQLLAPAPVATVVDGAPYAAPVPDPTPPVVAPAPSVDAQLRALNAQMVLLDQQAKALQAMQTQIAMPARVANYVAAPSVLAAEDPRVGPLIAAVEAMTGKAVPRSPAGSPATLIRGLPTLRLSIISSGGYETETADINFANVALERINGEPTPPAEPAKTTKE